jgi:DNA-binding NarL/FixJ family response regulator
MIRIFIKSQGRIPTDLLNALENSKEIELVKEESAADAVLVYRGARKSESSTRITAREMEILNLIAQGEGNKTIADLLEITEHTVKFHISSIFQKLHVSSRTEAIRAGIQLGLISI